MTARSSPVATPRHTFSRILGGTSECHSAGRTPKRAAKRSMKVEVNAISGSRTSACFPARSAAATASK